MLIIGRDPTNPICVPEQAVSRQHARIALDGKRWLLTDLGSRNGTMVDGQFIQGDVELQHLHEIRIGDAIFKFVESRTRSASSPTGSTAPSPATGGRSSSPSSVGGFFARMDAIAADIERIAAPTGELSCVILGAGDGDRQGGRGPGELANRASGGAARSRLTQPGAAIPANLPGE